MKFIHKTILAHGILIVLAIATAEAGEHNTLATAISKIAVEIGETVKGEYGVHEVAIGDFSGPPQANANASNGIGALLKDRLEKAGIEISRTASIGLRGSYSFVSIPHPKFPSVDRQVLKLEVNFVDDLGKVLDTVAFELDDDHDIAALSGATADLPPHKDQQTRKRELIKSFKRGPTIDHQKVTPNHDSEFGIEILREHAGQYRPIKPLNIDDQAYVELLLGDIYAIKVFNRSEYEVAVSVSIDGLNMFAFSKDKLSFMVVPPDSERVIKGWHTHANSFNKFMIGNIHQSAVREIGASSGDVGMITVSFAAVWKPGETPPNDELLANQQKSSGDQLATQRGPQFQQNMKIVKRHVGVVRSVTSIRYGSH